MKPNKKDIQTWIDALRSGKYKQTKYVLQNRKGYCCLGVACEIFIPKKKAPSKKQEILERRDAQSSATFS